MTIKTFWHAENPWADNVVYVPLAALAEAVSGGTVTSGGESVPYTSEFVLTHWAAFGDKLDAYILPQPAGRHSIGVRFGGEGSEYLSPYNANPGITNALLAKYRA